MRPMGAALIHTARQTDGQTEMTMLIGAFCYFVEMFFKLAYENCNVSVVWKLIIFG